MVRPAPDQVAPYPWAGLRRVDRHTVSESRRIRRAVARAIDTTEISRAIEQLVATGVDLVVHDVTVVSNEDESPALPPARVGLQFADGSAELLVGVDSLLATGVLRRVLARPLGLDNPRAPWSPALQGALEAVALEIARLAAADRAIAVVVPPVYSEYGSSVLVRATVSVEGRPHAAAVLVKALRSLPIERPDWSKLRGDFAVEVPVVVGVSSASPAEVDGLAPGDAWSCGAGWTIDVRGIGEGVLASPTGETGVLVDLAEDGSIVVRGEIRHLPLEEERGAMEDTNSTDMTTVVVDAIAATPVVVRVEMACVSLLAREWAELQVGDVLGTDQRIGEPVRLRIGGREVARGELVDISGELGVKISSLVGEANS